MKRLLSLSIIFIFLSGCMSTKIKMPTDNLKKIQKIAIVPMEAQPLEVTYIPFESGLPAKVLSYAGPGPGGGLVVMVAGVIMSAQMPEQARQSAKTAKSYDSLVSSEEAWIPTIILSHEAAKIITDESKYNVTVSQNLQKIPGLTNREHSWHLHNWMAPIRSWYNQDISSFEYKFLKDQGVDAVLEIGLMNYSLSRTSMLVQVGVKLVDPLTSKVLGRARAFESLIDTDTFYINENLFENNGKNFKDLFTSIGIRLLTKDLKYIGLLPE